MQSKRERERVIKNFGEKKSFKLSGKTSLPTGNCIYDDTVANNTKTTCTIKF